MGEVPAADAAGEGHASSRDGPLILDSAQRDEADASYDPLYPFGYGLTTD